MSAINFAKHAFGLEKPHSSITNWVDILTGPGYAEEAYDGIPELVESINIQAATGPGEASRAIRKKIKHGDAHQQYRAIVLLNALVDNCGPKFHTSFADGQLTDALKHLASDSSTNPRVKRKLTLVAASWNAQFKNDSYMYWVPQLHRICQGKQHVSRPSQQEHVSPDLQLENERRREKEEAKAKAKQEKIDTKERERKRIMDQNNKNRRKRPPFNFEQEKPQVLNSIANASQASSNLANAITLVNHESDDIRANLRVQECLEKAKQARKQIVRYIQLVENEEVIGTLIETNDRIIAAIEMYDQLSAAWVNKQETGDDTALSSALAATHLAPSDRGELSKLQGKQREAVERARKNSYNAQTSPTTPDRDLHPDLQDLSFGALGSSSSHLPPPMRPSSRGDRRLSDDDNYYRGGSLSDYSDYDSSDDARRGPAAGPARRGWVDVSDDEDTEDEGRGKGTNGRGHVAGGGAGSVGVGKGPLVDIDDPFADPVAGR